MFMAATAVGIRCSLYRRSIDYVQYAPPETRIQHINTRNADYAQHGFYVFIAKIVLQHGFLFTYINFDLTVGEGKGLPCPSRDRTKGTHRRRTVAQKNNSC